MKTSNKPIFYICVLATIASLNSVARASTITNEATVETQIIIQGPSSQGGIASTIRFPRFDPAMGQLQAVRFEIDVTNHYTIQELNVFSSPLSFTESFLLNTSVSMSGNGGYQELLFLSETGGTGTEVTIPPNSAHQYSYDYRRRFTLDVPLNAFFEPLLTGDGLATVRCDQRWFATQSYGATTASGDVRFRAIYEYSEAVRLSIRTSQVELCFASTTNRTYQFQYRSNLTSNEWMNLGSQITGDGLKKCVADTVPDGEPQRFYRALTLD